jgi:Protein of unknown function (DUF2934)
MSNEEQLERRIRERAHRIWEEEGRPQGREAAHWELARLAIAQEDAQASMLRPVETADAEPNQAVINQGEFPTLTDQGEQRNPGEIAEDPESPAPARKTR